jgi:hypothetical protein
MEVEKSHYGAISFDEERPREARQGRGRRTRLVVMASIMGLCGVVAFVAASRQGLLTVTGTLNAAAEGFGSETSAERQGLRSADGASQTVVTDADGNIQWEQDESGGFVTIQKTGADGKTVTMKVAKMKDTYDDKSQDFHSEYTSQNLNKMAAAASWRGKYGEDAAAAAASMDSYKSGYTWNAFDEFGACKNGDQTCFCGQGTQERQVACIREDGVIVDDEKCSDTAKPATTQVCTNYGCCDYGWCVTPWSFCTEACGASSRTRTATCKRFSTAPCCGVSKTQGMSPVTCSEDDSSDEVRCCGAGAVGESVDPSFCTERSAEVGYPCTENRASVLMTGSKSSCVPVETVACYDYFACQYEWVVRTDYGRAVSTSHWQMVAQDNKKDGQDLIALGQRVPGVSVSEMLSQGGSKPGNVGPDVAFRSNYNEVKLVFGETWWKFRPAQNVFDDSSVGNIKVYDVETNDAESGFAASMKVSRIEAGRGNPAASFCRAGTSTASTTSTSWGLLPVSDPEMNSQPIAAGDSYACGCSGGADSAGFGLYYAGDTNKDSETCNPDKAQLKGWMGWIGATNSKAASVDISGHQLQLYVRKSGYIKSFAACGAVDVVAGTCSGCSSNPPVGSVFSPVSGGGTVNFGSAADPKFLCELRSWSTGYDDDGIFVPEVGDDSAMAVTNVAFAAAADGCPGATYTSVAVTADQLLCYKVTPLRVEGTYAASSEQDGVVAGEVKFKAHPGAIVPCKQENGVAKCISGYKECISLRKHRHRLASAGYAYNQNMELPNGAADYKTLQEAFQATLDADHNSDEEQCVWPLRNNEGKSAFEMCAAWAQCQSVICFGKGKNVFCKARGQGVDAMVEDAKYAAWTTYEKLAQNPLLHFVVATPDARVDHENDEGQMCMSTGMTAADGVSYFACVENGDGSCNGHCGLGQEFREVQCLRTSDMHTLGAEPWEDKAGTSTYGSSTYATQGWWAGLLSYYGDGDTANSPVTSDSYPTGAEPSDPTKIKTVVDAAVWRYAYADAENIPKKCVNDNLCHPAPYTLEQAEADGTLSDKGDENTFFRRVSATGDDAQRTKGSGTGAEGLNTMIYSVDADGVVEKRVQYSAFGCDEASKPAAARPCFDFGSCAVEYVCTPWTVCTACCGTTETVTRHCYCVRSSGEQAEVGSIADEKANGINEIYCTRNELEKPLTSTLCGSGKDIGFGDNDDRVCRYYWFTGEWSAITPSCGPTYQNREVSCKKRVMKKNEENVCVADTTPGADEISEAAFSKCDGDADYVKWDLAMRINEDDTFGYSSDYWTNFETLNADVTAEQRTGSMPGNRKLASFGSFQFNSMMVCTCLGDPDQCQHEFDFADVMSMHKYKAAFASARCLVVQFDLVATLHDSFTATNVQKMLSPAQLNTFDEMFAAPLQACPVVDPADTYARMDSKVCAVDNDQTGITMCTWNPAGSTVPTFEGCKTACDSGSLGASCPSSFKDCAGFLFEDGGSPTCTFYSACPGTSEADGKNAYKKLSVYPGWSRTGLVADNQEATTSDGGVEAFAGSESFSDLSSALEACDGAGASDQTGEGRSCDAVAVQYEAGDSNPQSYQLLSLGHATADGKYKVESLITATAAPGTTYSLYQRTGCFSQYEDYAVADRIVGHMMDYPTNGFGPTHNYRGVTIGEVGATQCACACEATKGCIGFNIDDAPSCILFSSEGKISSTSPSGDNVDWNTQGSGFTRKGHVTDADFNGQGGSRSELGAAWTATSASRVESGAEAWGGMESNNGGFFAAVLTGGILKQTVTGLESGKSYTLAFEFASADDSGSMSMPHGVNVTMSIGNNVILGGTAAPMDGFTHVITQFTAGGASEVLTISAACPGCPTEDANGAAVQTALLIDHVRVSAGVQLGLEGPSTFQVQKAADCDPGCEPDKVGFNFFDGSVGVRFGYLTPGPLEASCQVGTGAPQAAIGLGISGLDSCCQAGAGWTTRTTGLGLDGKRNSWLFVARNQTKTEFRAIDDCTTTFADIRADVEAQNGDPLVVTCKADCSAAGYYNGFSCDTEITNGESKCPSNLFGCHGYTSDTSVCGAAVHATGQVGGHFTITTVPSEQLESIKSAGFLGGGATCEQNNLRPQVKDADAVRSLESLFVVHTGFAAKAGFRVDGMQELKHKIQTSSKDSDELAGLVGDSAHQYGGVESCAVKCNAYSGCTAWQYEESSASCTLYSGTPAFAETAGYTSGALSTAGRPASFQTVVNIDNCECEWSDPDSTQWCEGADQNGCVQGGTGMGAFIAQKFCYCEPWSEASVIGLPAQNKCDKDGTCVQTRSSTCIVNQLAEDDDGIASNLITAYNGIKCPKSSTKYASVCQDQATDSGLNFCDCGRRLTEGLGASAGAETCDGAEMCKARDLLITAGGSTTAPAGCTGKFATSRVLTKSCAEAPRPKDYNLGCCTNVDDQCEAWTWVPEACSCGDNVKTRDVCFKMEAPTAQGDSFTCSTTGGAVTGFNWICPGDEDAGDEATPRPGDAAPMKTTMSDANTRFAVVTGLTEPVEKPSWAVYNFVVGGGNPALGTKNTQSCKYDRSCDCEGGCKDTWSSQDLFGEGGAPACVGTAMTEENMEVTPRTSSDPNEECPSQPGCCTSMWAVEGDWGPATGCGVCEQTRNIECIHECLKKVSDSYCACLQSPPTRRLIGCYNDCDYKWHVQKRNSCLGRDFKCASAQQAGCHFHPVPDGTIQRWSRATVREGTISDKPGHPETALPATDDIIWDPRHPHCWWSVASDFRYNAADSLGYTAYEDAEKSAVLPSDENLVADADQLKKFFYYADSGSAVLKLDLTNSQYGGAVTSSSLPEDAGIKVDTSNVQACSSTVNPCATGEAPDTGMFSVNPSKGYVWTPSDSGTATGVANGMIRYSAGQEYTYTFAIKAIHGLAEETNLCGYEVDGRISNPGFFLEASDDAVAGPTLVAKQDTASGNTKSASAQITYGKFTHIAIVGTPTKLELYVDGQVVSTTAIEGRGDLGAGALVCGHSSGNVLSGNVEIYGLHVYLKALTGSEINKDKARGQAVVASGNGDLESTDTGGLEGNAPIPAGSSIEGFKGTAGKVWAIYERSSLEFPAYAEGGSKALGLQGGGSSVTASLSSVEPGLRYVVSFRTATPSTRYLGCYKDVVTQWGDSTCDARASEAEAAFANIENVGGEPTFNSPAHLVDDCMRVASQASGSPRFFAPINIDYGCLVNADAPPAEARVASGNCNRMCDMKLCGGDDVCNAVSFYELINSNVNSLVVTVSNYNAKAMEGETKEEHLAKCPNNFCPFYSFDAMDAPGVWSTRVAAYVSLYKGKSKLQFSIASTAGDDALLLLDDVTVFNVQGAFVESMGGSCTYDSGVATVYTRIDADATVTATAAADEDCSATAQCADGLVCLAESGKCGSYSAGGCQEGSGTVSTCKFLKANFYGYEDDNIMSAAANGVLPQWYCASLCQSTFACSAFDTSADKTSCTIYTNADTVGAGAAAGGMNEGASCFMRA